MQELGNKRVFAWIILALCLGIVLTSITAQTSPCYQSVIIPRTTKITIDNIGALGELAQVRKEGFDDILVLPDNQNIIAPSSNGLQIYGLAPTNSPILSFFENCLDLEFVKFNSDGALVAVVEQNSQVIEIWDTESNHLLSYFEINGDEVTSIAFDRTNQRIAWSESEFVEIDDNALMLMNATIYTYEIRTQTLLGKLEGVADIISDIYFSSNSESIVFRSSKAGYSIAIGRWDISESQAQTIKETWFALSLYSESTDTLILQTTVSAGISNDFIHQLEFWDFQTMAVIKTIPLPPSINPYIYTGIAINTDASMLALGDYDGHISIWDTNTGTQLSIFQAHIGVVEQLSFIVDNHLLISLGNEIEQQTIRIWGIIEP